MNIRYWFLKVLEAEKPKVTVLASFFFYFIFCLIKVCFLTDEQLFSLHVLPCGSGGGAPESLLVVNTVFIQKQS